MRTQKPKLIIGLTSNKICRHRLVLSMQQPDLAVNSLSKKQRSSQTAFPIATNITSLTKLKRFNYKGEFNAEFKHELTPISLQRILRKKSRNRKNCLILVVNSKHAKNPKGR
jgi:site-specific DNA-adenine methylase